MRTVCKRLHRGDDLLGSIRALAEEAAIEAGVVLSAVGCISRGVVRDASGVNLKTIDEPCEIVSLNGTVSRTRCHLHIALSKEDLSAVGGHLVEGCIINTTCELSSAFSTAGASAWSRTAKRAMMNWCLRKNEEYDTVLY